MVIRTIKELIKSNNNAIKDIIDNVYSLFDNKEITENNEVLGVFLDNIIIPSLSSSFSDNYVDDKIETKISREEHKFDKYQQLNDEEVERIEKKRIEAEIKKKEDEKKLEEKKKIAIAKKKEKEELNQKIKEEYEKTTYKDINEKFDNIIFEITSNIPGIDKNKLNNCVDELSKEQDKYIKSILLNFCELMKIKNKFNNISELSNSDINKLLKNFNSKSKELSKITSQYSKEFINKNIVIIDEFFKSNEYLEFITQYNPFEKLYSLINKFINIRKEIIIYYLYNQDILDVNNWLDNKSSSSTLNTNQLQISNAISVAPAAGVDVAAAPAAAAPAAGVDVAALSPMPFSLPVAVAAAAAAAPAAGIFVSPVALADGAAPFAPVVDAVLSTPRVFLSPLVSLPQPIPLDGVDVAADADAGVAAAADAGVAAAAAIADGTLQLPVAAAAAPAAGVDVAPAPVAAAAALADGAAAVDVASVDVAAAAADAAAPVAAAAAAAPAAGVAHIKYFDLKLKDYLYNLYCYFNLLLIIINNLLLFNNKIIINYLIKIIDDLLKEDKFNYDINYNQDLSYRLYQIKNYLNNKVNQYPINIINKPETDKLYSILFYLYVKNNINIYITSFKKTYNCCEDIISFIDDNKINIENLSNIILIKETINDLKNIITKFQFKINELATSANEELKIKLNTLLKLLSETNIDNDNDNLKNELKEIINYITANFELLKDTSIDDNLKKELKEIINYITVNFELLTDTSMENNITELLKMYNEKTELNYEQLTNLLKLFAIIPQTYNEEDVLIQYLFKFKQKINIIIGLLKNDFILKYGINKEFIDDNFKLFNKIIYENMVLQIKDEIKILEDLLIKEEDKKILKEYIKYINEKEKYNDIKKLIKKNKENYLQNMKKYIYSYLLNRLI